ncbi:MULTISPECIES: acyltransferase [Pseudidiomarina]|uniref:Galactoside O-acetyltransferase n=2 Tax=Pseudidiomarina TaxID=2800384 RepID=A0A368UMF7_9GAMM|nr:MULTISPECIES: acyltransferase [Pseudidiomarina]PWW10380.1 galactoside O-acetyltransferase [Pseudidiomarina maritima]RBP87915.1 galactoside O-acetyltransferase [Pseudidiomarina tainanensis]RCW29966.1 galactoside O-acetyltransferase [Pseudidiomarina tainanensis]
MAYLTVEQLESLNFKRLGKGVKVSEKASIYDAEKIELGDFCRIDDFCVISGKVKFGNYCHVTPMCLIAGGEPGIEISDFCTFAYGVRIFSQSDDYSGNSMVNSLIPKKFKRELFSKVVIHRQVIVGAGATIFPGVVVSEGCAIGAMSLVTKTTEPWSVYVGTPAQRIKSRSKKILELEKQFLSDVNHDPI